MELPIRRVAHPPLDDPAEQFLVASRLSPLVSESSSGPYAHELVFDPAALARFGEPVGIPDRPGVDLDAWPDGTALPLVDALRARRSASAFGTVGIDGAALACVLGEALRVTRAHGRGSPSPGGLRPIDAYVVCVDVDGVPPGAYGYHPRLHRLVPLGIAVDARAWVRRVLVHQRLAAGAAAVVLLAAAFDRVRVKYGQRAYRFALLEAGHVAQSMTLLATASGIASCVVGGYLDDEVDRTLGLDGLAATVLHTVALGSTPESDA